MEPRRLPTSIPPISAPRSDADLLPWARKITALLVQTLQRIVGTQIVTMENVSDGALLKRSGSTVVDGAGGSGSPSLPFNSVQFNDGGAFGGDAGLVYDKALDNLTIGSTGIIPRLGPASTATTGGALRIVEGVKFSLTVAGVQAALDECEAAGGGTVYVPMAAGISITTVSIKIPNRVTLIGFGDHGSTATFVAANSANVSAMVENKTQDGTQQFAAVANISLNGNLAGGAVVTNGLKFVKVYAGSYWRNVLAINISGDACLLDGGTTGGLGPVLVDALTVGNNGGHNIIVNGPCVGVHFYHLDSERPGTGKAALKITNSSASASFGHAVYGGYLEESDATADGIWLDGVANCRLDNILFNGTAAANVVKITGSVGGSDGAFAAGGHVITNITGNLATIIDDQVAGVTIGNAQGRFVRHYTSPVASATLDKSQIIGLQTQRQGADIAASSTITPGDGNYFNVTGTTSISTVTAAARDKGRIITLRMTSTAAINSGGNIILLHDNFIGPADRTLTLECDGTNWREIARNAPLVETSGPTLLTLGAVADGFLLERVGTTLVGVNPATLPVIQSWLRNFMLMGA